MHSAVMTKMDNEQMPFKTLAFFDLETTGLPELEFNKTKITQLCIVACSVQHVMNLQSKNDIPRVKHKLSLCFNPFKLIRIEASDVTGLTNELLENEQKFNDNSADLIVNFLNQLQSPILFIAHNGFRFDYPIIKRHFSVLKKFLPESVRYCDSLEIFRKIDEIYEENSKVLVNGYTLRSWEKLRDETVQMYDAEIIEVELYLRSSESNDENVETIRIEDELIKNEPNEFLARQRINETTPNKPTVPENKRPRSREGSEQNQNGPSTSAHVRRELFPESSNVEKKSPPANKWPKGKYKLPDIYRRIFGELPENSHDAESDVMALLKCVIAYKKEFLQLASTMNKAMCDINEP